MPRLDTRLESEGAEFLVLGALLLERIPTYKTYTNMPGYDLVATNPERNKSAKIQVKSRWATKASAFPINNFQCDFVVFVKLNRGDRQGKAKVMAPDFFVFPVGLVQGAPRTKKWGKVTLKSLMATGEPYRDGWDLIRTFLELPGRDVSVLNN